MDKATLPGLEITKDSLVISTLSSEHVGVYQCVARSDRGSAIASRPAHVAIAGTYAENDPIVRTCPVISAAVIRNRGKGTLSRPWSPAAEWWRRRKQVFSQASFQSPLDLNEHGAFLCAVLFSVSLESTLR